MAKLLVTGGAGLIVHPIGRDFGWVLTATFEDGLGKTVVYLKDRERVV